jgi:hypothetical protein
LKLVEWNGGLLDRIVFHAGLRTPAFDVKIYLARTKCHSFKLREQLRHCRRTYTAFWMSATDGTKKIEKNSTASNI